MNRSARAASLNAALFAAMVASARSESPDAAALQREGERIASGAGRVAACVSCHGVGGMGEAGAGFPRLAGLHAVYLAKQLDDYAANTRPSDVMKPIAAALSHRERLAVSAYYEDLKGMGSGPLAASITDPALVQEGALLWAQGSASKHVQACGNCHSHYPSAATASIYPLLAGQPHRYVADQLRQFRDGRRINDIGKSMRSIAARLTDRDIDALAAFVASLPP